MKKVIILGVGSFGELADFYFREDAGYDVVGFMITSDQKNYPITFKDRPVICFDNIEKHYDPSEVEVFVAVGYLKMNETRNLLCDKVKQKGFNLISYVSSKATVWPDMIIGENVFIFEDNTIQPFSKIGNGVVMWSGNHIGHHSTIEEWVFISSHAVISGHCLIGEKSFLGVNCTIADGVNIGKQNLIGPGALIQKNTSPGEAWFTERSKKFAKPSSFFFK